MHDSRLIGALPQWARPLASVLLAIAAIAVSTAITVQFLPWIGQTPYALLHLAVLFCVVIGGGVAGWTAVGLSMIAADYYLIAPFGAFSVGLRALAPVLFSGSVASAMVLLVSRIRQDRVRRHAQVALARSVAEQQAEERFKSTLDAMLEGCQLLDFDWRYLYINEAAAGHNRRPAHELLGRTMPEAWPGIEATRVYAMLKECFERRQPVREEVEFQFVDGTSSWFDVHVQPIPEGVFVLSVDISTRHRAEAERNLLLTTEQAARHEAEEARAKVDQILESVTDAFVTLDHNWRYVYVNERAARIFGRTREQLLGKHIWTEFPEGVGQPFQLAYEKAMRERVEIQFEEYYPPYDTYFENRIYPTAEGISIVFQDISVRKRAERALRETNEELERRIELRTTELRDALARAESADRVKSAFLATMSHELRTPLNSIIGFTGIVLQGLAGPLTAEQSKQLGMVRGSARHLLDLINDVLDISKIEAGQMEVRSEPVDLHAAIEQALATVRPTAEQKGLGLLTELPESLPELQSDRRRVDQILLNLLNNAVKFTDHGTITLRVSRDPSGATESDQPRVRIQITDTGIGIKPADLATLFQPFRQVDSGLARQHEGTGLGLAICRRLAELLGGTIHAESVWGQGSTFTVTLPIGSAVR